MASVAGRCSPRQNCSRMCELLQLIAKTVQTRQALFYDTDAIYSFRIRFGESEVTEWGTITNERMEQKNFDEN